MTTRRVVMHAIDSPTARRIAKALDCAVTLSENHPSNYVTLCGFDDALDEALPVLRRLAPGWYVRTPAPRAGG